MDGLGHTLITHIVILLQEFGKLRELNLEGCKGDGLNYILQTCAMMRSLNLGFMVISNIHCQLIGGAYGNVFVVLCGLWLFLRF